MSKQPTVPKAIIAAARNATVFQRRRITRSRPGNVSYSDALETDRTSGGTVLDSSSGLEGALSAVCDDVGCIEIETFVRV
jgi:hypothetical protein